MTLRAFLTGSVLLLTATTAGLASYVRVQTVSGPSEAPTLLLGDRVLINYAAYDLNAPYSTRRLMKTGEPQRGELVLFDVPMKGMLGLKRVIGLPGDRVHLKDNRLYLNGAPVSYQRLNPGDFRWVPPMHKLGSEIVHEEGFGLNEVVAFSPSASPVASFGPLTVPPGNYFLLGDHRDNSNDSRYFGCIQRSRIHGKVIYGSRTNLR